MARFNRPLPGNSLTGKLGSKPWERPPQLNTVEEALSHYMSRMSDQDTMDDLMVAIESGIPIKPLVESLYTSGVMRGLHTLDVGLLIAPALTEFFIAVADSYGIKYKYSNRDPKEEMKKRERNRITMLLNAAINRAEDEGTDDQGTDMLREMVQYTSSDMTRAEAAEAAPEAPTEPVAEEGGAPMEAPVEAPVAAGGGAGLMARPEGM